MLYRSYDLAGLDVLLYLHLYLSSLIDKLKLNKQMNSTVRSELLLLGQPDFRAGLFSTYCSACWCRKKQTYDGHPLC